MEAASHVRLFGRDRRDLYHCRLALSPPVTAYVAPLTMTRHFLAVPLTPVSIPVGWRNQGREATARLDPSTVTIHAAGDQASVWWKAYTDAIILSLPPATLVDDREEWPQGRGGLKSVLSIRDSTAVSLMHTLLADAKAGHPSGRMFGEHVLQALSVHLNHSYGSAVRKRHPILPPRIIRQVCDYIESELSTPLSVATIAAAVNLSQFHVNRSFRTATGYSLWAYVLRKRVEQSKTVMRCAELSLLEVSQRVGFESYSQFVAAFKRVVGVRPSEFRRYQETERQSIDRPTRSESERMVTARE